MSSFIKRITQYRKTIALFALAVLLFGAWVVSAPPTSDDAPFDKFTAHSIPKPLPDIAFTRPSKTSEGGYEPAQLSAYRGQVVLLNLWAVWCAPCREEMPQLDALQARFADAPFVVLALSLDRGAPEKPMRFLERLGIRHLAPAFDAKGASQRALGVFGLPTTLLIDTEGREIGRVQGIAKWDSAGAVDLIKRALER